MEELLKKGYEDVYIISNYIERKRKRKAGSCHLAVKKVMRVLEREGSVIIRGPKDQFDTYKIWPVKGGKYDLQVL